ncbi:hypothetical protein HAZT_HAZT002671 [Hyalella azteca]|uniref:Cadherin domain-containing protein n=1 Tax=Hyalella azteca TaxID=294128 RepID=A0A6A0H778_HYAAZ|nr:hypothetical protein HAZT_HAZT002671 [Hyalella azteca]
MGVSLESLPEAGRVQYSIVSGDPEGFFAVEEEQVGGISVLHIRTKTGLRDVLNRERQSSYTITTTAEIRSSTNVVYSATTTIHVEVEDTNDNIPLFFPDSYTVDAPEDLLLNTRLVQVKAHDADSGRNGEVYYYLSDAMTNLFAVHPITGVVSLTRSLQGHITKEFHIKVLARDRGSDVEFLRESAIGQADVTVSVVAMNNSPPKIAVRHLPSVVEHAHAHIYGIITVTDPDDGPSGEIELVEIVDGDHDRVFSIGRGEKPNEYNLMVLRLLDRELAPAGFNLTIRATDRGRPRASADKSVSVVIADVNDHAPVFIPKEYDVSISEEAPPNTPVVRLFAIDSDLGKNGEVTFEIVSGNPDRKFEINSATGVISTADWLDAESKSYFSLTVAAMDSASPAVRRQSTTGVIIRVLDSNDNAPTFLNIDDVVEVNENEPAGSFVIRVAASDSDSSENGFLSYSLVNGNQVPFTIDPFDGIIRTAKVLDFETGKKSYTLRVKVSDWGQPYKHETQTIIQVTVKDINDNRPQFLTSDCSGWISVNTHKDRPIVTLKAVDLDADTRVRYQLIGNTNRDCWFIDPDLGTITANCNLRAAVLLRARTKTVMLNVTASDGRYMSDPVMVTLNVYDPQYNDPENMYYARDVTCRPNEIAREYIDVELSAHVTEMSGNEEYQAIQPYVSENFHAPIISSKTPISVEVPENALVGSEVLVIAATDKDRSFDGRLVYAIASGNIDSVFEINMITGVVRLSAALDREKRALYVLNITVYDSGQPRLSSSINVTVQIMDINDNAPQFLRFSYHLHLPENMKIGTSVAQLQAVDADEGNNALVTYKLISNTRQFRLNSNSGILELVAPLDREKIDQYELKVRAWDGGEDERRYSDVVVHITVLDINDCAPDFGAAKFISISVPEDYPVGAVVAIMQATDLDVGQSAVVSYSFVEDDNANFRIDKETGVVRITSPLDFEKTRLHNLTIKASDKGFPPLHSFAQLIIHVEDVEETIVTHEFKQRIARGWIRENEPPGTLATTLAVSGERHPRLQFAITDGDGHGYFAVNSRGKA